MLHLKPLLLSPVPLLLQLFHSSLASCPSFFKLLCMLHLKPLLLSPVPLLLSFLELFKPVFLLGRSNGFMQICHAYSEAFSVHHFPRLHLCSDPLRKSSSFHSLVLDQLLLPSLHHPL